MNFGELVNLALNNGVLPVKHTNKVLSSTVLCKIEREKNVIALVLNNYYLKKMRIFMFY